MTRNGGGELGCPVLVYSQDTLISLDWDAMG